MANDYARVMRSIWADDDFRELSHDAQWLYFHMLTNPSITYCGVTDWRPTRIAALTNDLTADAVEGASVELEAALYTVVDRDTEEALIRTFIRHDGLMNSPNMAAAMVKAHSAIVSRAIRGVVVHELKRLQADEPDLRGWVRDDVKKVLRRVPVNPVEAVEQLPRYGFGLPSSNPSVKGSLKGSDQGSSTPAPTPAPTPNSPQASDLTYSTTEGNERRAAS